MERKNVRERTRHVMPRVKRFLRVFPIMVLKNVL